MWTQDVDNYCWERKLIKRISERSDGDQIDRSHVQGCAVPLVVIVRQLYPEVATQLVALSSSGRPTNHEQPCKAE